MIVPIGEEPHTEVPAGFWRRILAGLFDGLLLLTVAIALLVELIVAVDLAQRYGWASGAAVEEQLGFWVSLTVGWALLAGVMLPVSYFTICEGGCGQTLGKRLFGIVVVTAAGHPIGYGRAFARLLTLPYSLLPAGLGLLWMALPPRKRAWHDYISATQVIAHSERHSPALLTGVG